MKAIPVIVLVFFLSCFMLGTGCSQPDFIKVEGTIRYINVEDGFWGIVGTDGKKYDPINLESKYRTDGQVVNLKAEILHDPISSYHRGVPIKINIIEIITTSC